MSRTIEIINDDHVLVMMAVAGMLLLFTVVGVMLSVFGRSRRSVGLPEGKGRHAGVVATLLLIFALSSCQHTTETARPSDGEGLKATQGMEAIVEKGKDAAQAKPCDSDVLKATQSKEEIVVENKHDSMVAIRISWDGADPDGKGEGRDSYLDNSVYPRQIISRKIDKHTSVQIWAWGTDGDLLDSCWMKIYRD